MEGKPEVRGFLKGGEQFISIPHSHVGTIYSHLGRTGNILNLIMFLPLSLPPIMLTVKGESLPYIPCDWYRIYIKSREMREGRRVE